MVTVGTHLGCSAAKAGMLSKSRVSARAAAPDAPMPQFSRLKVLSCVHLGGVSQGRVT